VNHDTAQNDENEVFEFVESETVVCRAATTPQNPAKAKSFSTAGEAANALIEAAEKFDETALTEILGSDSYDIVHTGEPARGFALIAFSAQYRLTGVQTFMVSHDGVVYQKDLGPNTLDLAGAIDRFNPDKSWTPVLEK
jgi:hypothetical protein